MDHDVPEETLTTRGNLKLLLGGLPLFSDLDYDIVSEIAEHCEWLSVPGGATLYEATEPSDALYIVLAGCLGNFAPKKPGDRRRFLGRVTAGEMVGEMGLISGRPRTASVIALRDSEIARLSKRSFDRVFGRHPAAMLKVAQVMVQRLEHATLAPRGRSPGPRSIAIIPQSIEVDVASFAVALVDALRRNGRAELVWSVRGADHTSHWFHKVEASNDYVVYVADPGASTWTKLCMRQADTLLLLAAAQNEAAPWPALAQGPDQRAALQRAELVLLHDGAIVAGAAQRWLAVQPGLPHHHVRSAEDVPRVARMLTGTAVGLVLSGGGARGFAHLGVIRALRERGIPIDMVGGTSIGAIMGAAAALGWPDEQLVDVFRRTFVDSNPLGDYTLPVVSLVSGRRVSERLRREFGEVRIEDLPLSFYCVSTNLTSGTAAVHRNGELWRWLRASVAIPGVLPPVMYQGQVFVDGATINNLPVDVMRESGACRVIGVDVGADPAFTSDVEDTDMPPLWRVMTWFRGRRRRPNIFQILWRSGMINSAAATAARRDQTDLLLHPPLENVDLLGWRAFEAAMEAGYTHTLESLDRLPAGLQARGLAGSTAASPDAAIIADDGDHLGTSLATAPAA